MKEREEGLMEARWKMDKFMPDSAELQDEFHELVENRDTDSMEEFLQTWADEETLFRYLPKGATLREFAEFLTR